MVKCLNFGNVISHMFGHCSICRWTLKNAYQTADNRIRLYFHSRTIYLFEWSRVVMLLLKLDLVLFFIWRCQFQRRKYLALLFLLFQWVKCLVFSFTLHGLWFSDSWGANMSIIMILNQGNLQNIWNKLKHKAARRNHPLEKQKRDARQPSCNSRWDAGRGWISICMH